MRGWPNWSGPPSCRSRGDENDQPASEAVRRATVSNPILALTYDRTTAEPKQMGPEILKLTALLNRKAGADLTGKRPTRTSSRCPIAANGKP